MTYLRDCLSDDAMLHPRRAFLRRAAARLVDENRRVNRAVFLDLNGTLVSPLKPDALDDLILLPGAAEAVARLTAAGYVCPVVTVQSRIAKGLFSLADFEAWFVRFAADLSAKGARVWGPYVCPHRFAEPCPCKKPNRLLYSAPPVSTASMWRSPS